jgi:hypothetical protein
MRHVAIHNAVVSTGVDFTTKPVFSNFYGTLYSFPSMRIADLRKIEKATGMMVKGRRGNYHLTLY